MPGELLAAVKTLVDEPHKLTQNDLTEFGAQYGDEFKAWAAERRVAALFPSSVQMNAQRRADTIHETFMAAMKPVGAAVAALRAEVKALKDDVVELQAQAAARQRVSLVDE